MFVSILRGVCIFFYLSVNATLNQILKFIETILIEKFLFRRTQTYCFHVDKPQQPFYLVCKVKRIISTTCWKIHLVLYYNNTCNNVVLFGLGFSKIRLGLNSIPIKIIKINILILIQKKCYPNLSHRVINTEANIAQQNFRDQKFKHNALYKF